MVGRSQGNFEPNPVEADSKVSASISAAVSSPISDHAPSPMSTNSKSRPQYRSSKRQNAINTHIDRLMAERNINASFDDNSDFDFSPGEPSPEDSLDVSPSEEPTKSRDQSETRRRGRSRTPKRLNDEVYRRTEERAEVSRAVAKGLRTTELPGRRPSMSRAWDVESSKKGTEAGAADASSSSDTASQLSMRTQYCISGDVSVSDPQSTSPLSPGNAGRNSTDIDASNPRHAEQPHQSEEANPVNDITDTTTNLEFLFPNATLRLETTSHARIILPYAHRYDADRAFLASSIPIALPRDLSSFHECYTRQNTSSSSTPLAPQTQAEATPPTPGAAARQSVPGQLLFPQDPVFIMPPMLLPQPQLRAELEVERMRSRRVILPPPPLESLSQYQDKSERTECREDGDESHHPRNYSGGGVVAREGSDGGGGFGNGVWFPLWW